MIIMSSSGENNFRQGNYLQQTQSAQRLLATVFLEQLMSVGSIVEVVSTGVSSSR